MCIVGGRGDHEPRWLDFARGATERAERVAQLVDVAEDDDIERLVPDLVPHLRGGDVAGDTPVRTNLGTQRRRTRIDPVDITSALVQVPDEGALRTPDLEH